MTQTCEKYEGVYAILLIEGPAVTDAGTEVSITVKEVVRDRRLAESEVERLNRLDGDRIRRYMWQTTRLYIEGESMGTDPEEDAPPDIATT